MRRLRMAKYAYSSLAVSYIILGLIFLLWPGITLEFICKLIGLILIVFGAVKIISYFSRDLFQLAFQFDLGIGIISIMIGLVMLIRTQHLIEVVSIFVGALILLDAALKIQTAIEAKSFGLKRWWIILFIAIVVAVVGLLLLFIPLQMTNLITCFIGLNLCLDGILNLWVVQNTIHFEK